MGIEPFQSAFELARADIEGTGKVIYGVVFLALWAMSAIASAAKKRSEQKQREEVRKQIELERTPPLTGATPRTAPSGVRRPARLLTPDRRDLPAARKAAEAIRAARDLSWARTISTGDAPPGAASDNAVPQLSRTPQRAGKAVPDYRTPGIAPGKSVLMRRQPAGPSRSTPKKLQPKSAVAGARPARQSRPAKQQAGRAQQPGPGNLFPTSGGQNMPAARPGSVAAASRTETAPNAVPSRGQQFDASDIRKLLAPISLQRIFVLQTVMGLPAALREHADYSSGTSELRSPLEQ